MSLQKIFFVFNLLALGTIIGVLVTVARRRKRPTTPYNQTAYYNDETLEGPRLERVLGWALCFSAVVAVALPTYWLLEPGRQTRMTNHFLSESVARGKALFSKDGLNCAQCHGEDAGGGAATPVLTAKQTGGAPRRVTWKAPSLNDVLLRFPREQVIQIITYGRPGTPMPAWGVAGGGPKNTQSVEDLVAYLGSIQITPAKAKAKQAGITSGKALFDNNCARCHTKGASYGSPDVTGGGGVLGPSLIKGVILRKFPDPADHIKFVQEGSQFQKLYGVGGIGSGQMPGFAQILTEEQIKAIVAYERTF